jgi:amino acid permease
VVWPETPDWRWFSGWATMMLSYNCQITLFYVRGELMHKTEQRIRKVSRIFIGILVSFYLLICFSGYYSLGQNDIPKLITLRKPVGRLP